MSPRTGTTAESPATGTPGVRLSVDETFPESEKRTTTLSASRTRTDTTALSTLVGFGATDARVIVGCVGAVTPDAPSWHPASKDATSSITGRGLLQPCLIAATSLGNAPPR